jgi:putative transposase
MARTARIVIAGLPHHVTQRGNRRQQVFFSDEDRAVYLQTLKEESDKWGLKIWAYCLMDNHVHLIVVPSKTDSLAKSIGETHKRYTRRINFREKWRGYLWQGRFNSFVLDEKYLYAAVRYVERNPVRAKLVNKAEDYRWSSAKNHVLKKEDPVLSFFYLMGEIKDWGQYLTIEESKDDLKLMRKHGTTGRPLGSKEFIEHWSVRLGKDLKPKKVGRPLRN